MADDEKEARAATLASQALELVASGRDEVDCYPSDVCDIRLLGCARMALELYEKQRLSLQIILMSRPLSTRYSQMTCSIVYKSYA